MASRLPRSVSRGDEDDLGLVTLMLNVAGLALNA
jgi:hypothetical protein